MCLCVPFPHLSLYSSIWDESFGLIIGSGAPNGVKFDITNPDKITKLASYLLSDKNFQVYAFISFVYFLVISSSSLCRWCSCYARRLGYHILLL